MVKSLLQRCHGTRKKGFRGLGLVGAGGVDGFAGGLPGGQVGGRRAGREVASGNIFRIGVCV